MMEQTLIDLARVTKTAAQELALLPGAARDQAIEAIARALEAAVPDILAANAADCEAAQAEGIAASLYARLKLDETKLRGEIAGVRDVGRLPDPVGRLQIHRELDTGLVMQRVTCPVGVLGVIFEARPDAVIQISALAVKSGNGAILKGGREAIRSCQAIVGAVRKGLAGTAVRPEVIQLLTTREETIALLGLDDYVDLVIPRGANSFVRFVQDNTRIPVLGHASGMCHLYVDAAADLSKAVPIAVDAKVQYPAACNAIETLLVHRDIADRFLPSVAAALQTAGVVLRADPAGIAILEAAGAAGVEPATDDDWSTEYSALGPQHPGGRFGRGRHRAHRHLRLAPHRRHRHRGPGRRRSSSCPEWTRRACSSTAPPASPTASATGSERKSASAPRSCPRAARWGSKDWSPTSTSSVATARSWPHTREPRPGPSPTATCSVIPPTRYRDHAGQPSATATAHKSAEGLPRR